MRDEMSGTIPKIGYVPYSQILDQPADRRRFVAYARARKLPFEFARPGVRYDVIVLSEVADIPIWSESQHGKIVYDLIDSYLAVPRTDIRQFLRGIAWFASGRHSRLCFDFKSALQKMCRRADAVICTTEAQKKDILEFCQNVHVVLDIHDSVVKNVKSNYSAGTPFNLVWEGLPSNISQLKKIGPVLRDIAGKRPMVLNLVTDPDRPLLLNRFGKVKSVDVARGIFDNIVLHPWDEATWSTVITSCDVAIIPILDDAMSVGKPGNKLSLLWRIGMPVVTSATPAYLQMQRAAGLQKFACSNCGEWMIALDQLMCDEKLRREAGERGRSWVTSEMKTDRLLKQWDSVFASIGFNFETKAN